MCYKVDVETMMVTVTMNRETMKDIKRYKRQNKTYASHSCIYLSFLASFILSSNGLREVLILALNLLLDPQQHCSLPLVQLLHLVELVQAVCKLVLVSTFHGFLQVVKELEFAS